MGTRPERERELEVRRDRILNDTRDTESPLIFGYSTDVVYEASYVPFIFQSDAGEASSSSHQEERPKLRGRRTFNARGEEVVQEVHFMSRTRNRRSLFTRLSSQVKTQQQDEQAAADTPEQKPSLGSRFEKRPTSISGFSTLR